MKSEIKARTDMLGDRLDDLYDQLQLHSVPRDYEPMEQHYLCCRMLELVQACQTLVKCVELLEEKGKA